MLNIKTLVASCIAIVFTSSCGPLKFPPFPPSVNKQLVVVFDQGTPYCFEFDIVSTYPYKISEDPRLVELNKCDGLGGFGFDDMKKVTNWVDDVQRWVGDHTCRVKR